MQIEMIDGKPLEHWSVADVASAFEKHEIVLIDVRTPQEFALEHIGGALLAPMHELIPENLPTGTDKAIVLHCGSGIRSKRVAELCLSAGAGKIAHMAGGFSAWKEAGLPFIGTDLATGCPKAMRKPSA